MPTDLPQLRVHFLPEYLPKAAPPGEVAVVIDVLRATTTIAQALWAGATAVVPCLTVQQARQSAARLAKSGPVLLGGERGGLPIEGFDLGNSPAQYTRETVGGKRIVFTTTNGTKALAACDAAQHVYLAAAVNLAAVQKRLGRHVDSTIDIVCAGTDGQVTREDVLIAGALVARLCETGGEHPWRLTDSARLALAAWCEIVRGAHDQDMQLSDHLAGELRQTSGGRNLISIGRQADLALAARLESLDLVPQFDRARGEITAC